MKQILQYLKRRHVTDTQTINRLFVTAFITINQLKVSNNSCIHQYLIAADEEISKNLTWILKHLRDKDIEIGLEELISLFEFVISPSDREVTGAVYTPMAIRSRIISRCLGSIPVCTLAESRVADISCGCGGFLMDAARYIHQHTGKPYAEIYRDNIFGIDIEDYAIERTKILLTLLALTEGEDGNFEFNLLNSDTLEYVHDDRDERYRHFDVIVGNPPYVCSRNMTDEIRNRVAGFEVCRYGHPDLYIPFIQIAIENLNEGGRLGFITMNSFFNSLNGRGLREYFGERQLEVSIVDFRGYQVFNSRSTYTCLLFVNNTQADGVSYASAEDGVLEEDFHFEHRPYVQLNAARGWNLRQTGMATQIENNGIPLGQFCSSRHGIATLSNKTYIFKPQSETDDFYVFENDGVRYPIERGICRDIVNSNKLNSEVDYETLKEKVIYPYHIDGTGRTVVYSEAEMRALYPMALTYLQSQRTILEQRDKSHTEDYPAWYAYGRTQSLVMPQFKLFFPKIANKSLQCVLVDDAQLLLYNGMAFVSDDLQKLQVLKCFMESDVFWMYVSSNAKPYASGFYSLNGVNIKKFGIPNMSGEQIAALLSIENPADRNTFIRQLYGVLNYVQT